MKIYDSPLHRATRKAWKPVVEAGEAYCTEETCLRHSRWIDPEEPWDLAHDHSDPSGQTYRGPAHRGCNRSEGASRGNAQRRGPIRRHQI